MNIDRIVKRKERKGSHKTNQTSDFRQSDFRYLTLDFRDWFQPRDEYRKCRVQSPEVVAKTEKGRAPFRKPRVERVILGFADEYEA